MKKLFTLILIIIASYLVAGKTNAEEFDPYLLLKETELGQQLITLYDKAEAEPDEVFIHVNALMKNNELFKTPLYQFAYYRIIYIVEMARSRPDKAESAVNNLYQYAIESNTLWLKGEAQMWQSTFFSRRSEYDKAHALLEKVFPIARKTKFNRLLARAYNTRAIIHTLQNKRFLAKKDYLSALEIFEKQPNDPYLSIVNSNVSVLFEKTQQWEKAIYYNEKARQYYEKSANPTNLQRAILHSNAANIYREKHDLKSRQLEIEHLNIAKKFADLSGELYIKSNVIADFAKYYLNEGELTRAKTNANECLAIAEKISDSLIIAECSLTLGNIALLEQNYVAAERWMLQSEGIFFDVEAVTGLIMSYQQLALLYKTTNHFEKAYQYATLYYETKHKNLYDIRQNKFFELEEQYAAKAKENEITLLSTENALNSAKLEQQSLREKLWLLLIICGLLGVYILSKRYSLLKQLNDKLSIKNTQLFQESHNDELTHLFNRRHLTDYIKHIKKNAFNDNNQYAIAMLDIDYFKKVNDRYGHDAGDEVLIKVAQILNHNIRENDLAVRWGGEEFILLLSFSSQCNHLQILDRIRVDIENTPITTKAGTISITASMGVSHPQNAATLTHHWDTLQKRVDQALYVAKKSGRNCIKQSTDKVST